MRNQTEFESDSRPTAVIWESDAQFVEIVDRESFRRSISNYFFMSINVIVFLANMSLATSQLGGKFPPTVTLISIVIMSSVGYLLCVYWFYENRERSVRLEVTYRALMEREMQRGQDKGILTHQWEILGNMPFRRSTAPLFFITRYLPLAFCGVHSLPIYIGIFAGGIFIR
jgi:hypothetical protein